MADALPFKGLVSYDIEILFESSKKRIQRLMSDHRLTNFIKERRLSSILDSNLYTSCSYYDEEEFNRV